MSALIIQEMMELFWNKEITEEDMVSIYRDKVTNADFEMTLEIASKNKDGDLLENAFYVGFTFDLFIAGTESVLLKIILGDWHRKHEDIASIFQLTFNTDKSNVPVLLEAINTIPGYLQQEDYKYPYIRKLIYAIGAQPEPDNIEALKKLAQSGDEEIKRLALHQIEKREQLGRWEAEKHN